MTEKILVTGGGGFIGSYVIRRLLDLDYEVISFDHSVPGGALNRPTGVTQFLGDIKSETDVFEAMSHCSGFIHLAGVLGTQETIKNPTPAIMTNITGGLNVLEAAAHYKIPGVNIAVGNYWEENPYSISKNTVERLVRMFNAYRGTRVSTVRALNAYGPGQSVFTPYGNSQVRKIIPSFFARAIHGETIQVYGDGSQIMDMVYVEDVARVLVSALEFTLDNGVDTAFEVGTGTATSVLTVANAVTESLGLDPSEVLEFLPMRQGETASRPVLADVTSLIPLRYYGVDPTKFTVLSEGVWQTADYYKNLFAVDF